MTHVPPSTEDEDQELAFMTEAEEKADAFRRRYGLGPEDAWTDELLDRVLADHGYPQLAALPMRAEGLMRAMSQDPDPTDPVEQHRWQRVNAGHLIGHAIMHDGERCRGCITWG